jgi:hypothetical protein
MMRVVGRVFGGGIGASLALLAAVGMTSVPAAAQVRTVDPNTAIDRDLAPPSSAQQQASPAPPQHLPPADEPVPAESPAPAPQAPGEQAPAGQTPTAQQVPAGPAQAGNGPTYQEGDVLDAAEGVFGKGAKGLAQMIEKILKDQGKPNAYIAGREAAAAIAIGVRYGSGMMNHKVEGERKVFWTGPSIGFDVGGDATKVFVLVYNLYDSQDLYKRFPAVEGRVYLVGGFSATYLRRGNIVLIPVRLGVGWRLGANIGYMKFSEKSRIVPF